MKKILCIILSCCLCLIPMVAFADSHENGDFLGYYGSIPVVYYSNIYNGSLRSDWFVPYLKPASDVLSSSYFLAPSGTVASGYSLSGSGDFQIKVNDVFYTFLSGNFPSNSAVVAISDGSTIGFTYSSVSSGSYTSVGAFPSRWGYSFSGDLPSDSPVLIWDFDTFTIPPGYVLAVDTMVLQEQVSVESVSLSSSSLAVSTFGLQTFYSGQKWYSSDSFSLDGNTPWTIIQWTPTDFSVLKKNRSGTYSFSPGNKRYIFIMNPFSDMIASGSTKDLNGDVVVKFNVPDGFGVWAKLLPIDYQQYLGGTYNSHLINSDGEFYNWGAEYNEAGEVVSSGWYSVSSESDFSGAVDSLTVSTPVYGGSSDLNVDDLSSVNSLFNDLGNLFSSGASRLQHLVQSGSGFFSSLSDLFSWLPADMIAILSSVFIIFLIVACIKLFL